MAELYVVYVTINNIVKRKFLVAIPEHFEIPESEHADHALKEVEELNRREKKQGEPLYPESAELSAEPIEWGDTDNWVVEI